MIISQERKKSEISASESSQSNKKRTRSQSASNTSLIQKKKCLQTETINKNLYPKECGLCNLFSIKRKGKWLKPIKCVTKNAEKSVKAAAKAKNMEFYSQIVHII